MNFLETWPAILMSSSLQHDVNLHYDDVTWTSCSLKPPVTRPFCLKTFAGAYQRIHLTSMSALLALCDRWIPRTESQLCGKPYLMFRKAHASMPRWMQIIFIINTCTTAVPLQIGQVRLGGWYVFFLLVLFSVRLTAVSYNGKAIHTVATPAVRLINKITWHTK